MDKIVISADSRNLEGKSAKNLLEEGIIPGVVYGHQIESLPIQVSRKDFIAVFNEAGESSLVTLKVGGEDFGNVIIKDYNVDPIKGEIIHFDLHKVKMTEKLTANVSISFIGESPAVKNEGGVLVTSQDEIEIRCLPKDLIQEIEVDLSKLEHVDDLIRIKDLQIPENVEVLDEEENVIVSVTPPRSEEEMEGLEEKPEEDINKVEGAVKEEKEENKEEKK